MRTRSHIIILISALVILLASCTSPTPTSSPQPTTASQPTSAPQVTSEPQSTSTLPQPTATATSPAAQPIGRVAQAQDFLNLLVEQDFATAVELFDPTVKAALPEDKLSATWAQLLAQVGEFEQVLNTRMETEEGYERVTLTTKFKNADLDVRVVYNAAGEIAGLFFAPASTSTPQPGLTPAYSLPGSFEEIEVTVGSGEWALPGTLSMPVGEGPFPAVVLVHGSGPNDRDETIGPNKPFRDLAWGLASRGIAVLRYDKRTLVHGQKMVSSPTQLTVQQETVEDALLAVDLLRQTDKINPDQVYVLGHSLGGMLVPRIGAAGPQVAGFIILAGATRPLEEMTLEQITYIFNLDGSVNADEQRQIDVIQEHVNRIQSPDLTADTPSSDLLEIPAQYWLDLRGYYPPDLAKDLDRPTLVLQGGRDYQVTTVDFENWQQAVGDETWTEFMLYPSLNHLFISGEGQITPAEYQVPGNVAEEVIVDIAAWINP